MKYRVTPHAQTSAWEKRGGEAERLAFTVYINVLSLSTLRRFIFFGEAGGDGGGRGGRVALLQTKVYLGGIRTRLRGGEGYCVSRFTVRVAQKDLVLSWGSSCLCGGGRGGGGNKNDTATHVFNSLRIVH